MARAVYKTLPGIAANRMKLRLIGIRFRCAAATDDMRLDSVASNREPRVQTKTVSQGGDKSIRALGIATEMNPSSLRKPSTMEPLV